MNVLYFETHFNYYSPDISVIPGGEPVVKPFRETKNIKLLEDYTHWEVINTFKIKANDGKVKGVNVNEVWVDLDKYILRGINIPMISEVVNPYVRVMKLNKIKKKINVREIRKKF